MMPSAFATAALLPGTGVGRAQRRARDPGALSTAGWPLTVLLGIAFLVSLLVALTDGSSFDEYFVCSIAGVENHPYALLTAR